MEGREVEITHAISTSTFADNGLGARLHGGVVGRQLHHDLDEEEEAFLFTEISPNWKSWAILLELLRNLLLP